MKNQIWSAAQDAMDAGRAPLDDDQVQALIVAALASDEDSAGLDLVLDQIASLEQSIQLVERSSPIASTPTSRPILAATAAALLIIAALGTSSGTSGNQVARIKAPTSQAQAMGRPIPQTTSPLAALPPPRAFIKSLNITTERTLSARSSKLANTSSLFSKTTITTQTTR